MSAFELKHSWVHTNGIRMHYAEAGDGPLLVLLHGFPECWYSWRHQLSALAVAGFRAVAPDLRGYGQTEAPEALEAYDIFHLTGDVVGLVHGLGATSAVVVGHDWGSWVAAYLALLQPDLFPRTVLLSGPYVPRRAVSQSEWERQTYPGKIFYQAMLRRPMAEQYLEADIRGSLLRSYYRLSAQVAEEDRFRHAVEPGSLPTPVRPIRPPWLSEEDVDFCEGEFRRSGFRGGLNYYRNMDRNWSLTPFLQGARIYQPALFIGGDRDPVLEFHGREFEELEMNMPGVRSKVVLPGVGHWTQQEAPEEVNRLLLGFLEHS